MAKLGGEFGGNGRDYCICVSSFGFGPEIQEKIDEEFGYGTDPNTVEVSHFLYNLFWPEDMNGVRRANINAIVAALVGVVKDYLEMTA